MVFRGVGRQIVDVQSVGRCRLGQGDAAVFEFHPEEGPEIRLVGVHGQPGCVHGLQGFNSGQIPFVAKVAGIGSHVPLVDVRYLAQQVAVSIDPLHGRLPLGRTRKTVGRICWYCPGHRRCLPQCVRCLSSWWARSRIVSFLCDVFALRQPSVWPGAKIDSRPVSVFFPAGLKIGITGSGNAG